MYYFAHTLFRHIDDAVAAARESSEDGAPLYVVRPDEEAHSQEWWDAAYSAGLLPPGDYEGVVVGPHVLSALRALPGWDTGIEHAPHPLIVETV